MSATPEIKCPKCKSNQLSANKKGFSGKKAFAGVLLTGGIGALAGTIGSNNVVITCLNCGHEFEPGKGLKEVTAVVPEGLTGHDKEVIRLYQEKGKLQAINYYKRIKDVSLSEAKEYVEGLAAQNGLTSAQPAGCAAIVALIIAVSSLVTTIVIALV
jgi:hypothetical protein